MWELDHKEGRVWNWWLWTVVLKKTLDNPLDIKEIKPVNPKANQSWIFIGSTDAEAETPILWPPNANCIGKDPDAGKDWRQEEKGMKEDEMIGWYHWLNGHEFEQAPGVSDGRGGLAWCCPWSRKESDMTEWLNKNSKNSSPKFLYFLIRMAFYLPAQRRHFSQGRFISWFQGDREERSD